MGKHGKRNEISTKEKHPKMKMKMATDKPIKPITMMLTNSRREMSKSWDSNSNQ